MAKFTLTSLKKELTQKTKEELIQEISSLCQTFPQVKEYYKAQSSDVQELVKKYKAVIENEFIEGKTRGLPKARFSVARKALTDFKRLTSDPSLIADMMLTYVESISWFNSEYAPDAEEFYTKPEDMFEQALALIKKHHLENRFKLRAHTIVENSCEGWGHQDSLRMQYEAVYGKFVT
ncbi:MAG: hypothetical protein N838_03205 [Thiohalocapsa sp. PB-PSB1]|jgi:hypothetical protein|nr:MAG: hypothetical protein N838_32535 [Thiohalocapsa sp. PB-PSB1]QQO52526.1 MAG: hypothetical protein N838_03205 [Thiohalocapsa sp. PB-PSB1]HCS91664.1 hypothetical protein [Chromatiaceae bacterium]